VKISGTQLTMKLIFIPTIKVRRNDDDLNLGIQFSQTNGYIDPIQVLLKIQINKSDQIRLPQILTHARLAPEPPRRLLYQ